MRAHAMNAGRVEHHLRARVDGVPARESSGITISTWKGNSGDWGTASNWSNGIAPQTPNEAAVLGGSNAYAVDVSPAGSFTIDYLNINDAHAALTLPGSLTAYSMVNAGTFSMQSPRGNAVLDIGALNNTGNIIVDTGPNTGGDVLYDTGNASNSGTIAVGYAGSTFANQPFAYLLGTTVDTGVITTMGQSTLEYGTLTISGRLIESCAASLGAVGNYLQGAAILNNGSISVSGEGTIDSVDISNAGVIDINTGSVTGTISVYNSTLTNTGTIVLGGGTGAYELTLHLDNINNTGTINIASVQHGQAVDIIGTDFSNSGTFRIGSGSGDSVLLSEYTQTAGLTVDAGYLLSNLTVNGGDFALAGGVMKAETQYPDITAHGTLSGWGEIYPVGFPYAILQNAGLVAASGGAMNIDGVLTSVGAVTVASGALLNMYYGGTLNGSTVVYGALDAGLTTGIGGLALVDGGTISIGTGVIVDTGATLGGNGVINAPVSVGGTLVAGGGLLTVNGAVSGSGTMLAGAGATLRLTEGGTFAGAAGGAGTLQLDGASSFVLQAPSITTATVIIEAGAAVSGGGSISGSLIDNGTVTASAGTLTLAGAVAGNGALNAGSGAELEVTAGAVNAAVSLGIAAGGIIDFSNGGTISGSAAVAGTLSAASLLTLSGLVLIDGGVIADQGAVVIAAGPGLGGFGAIDAPVTVAGALVAGGGVLTVAGPVNGAGTLAANAGATLYLASGGMLGAAVTGQGTLQLGGVFAMGAGALSVANLAIGPAATLSGAGTISSAVVNEGAVSLSAGTLSFLGAVTNTGVLEAGGGVLSVAADVSGAGTLEIGAGGVLSLTQGSGAGQVVDFLFGGGSLDLGAPLAFLGTIAGFGSGDAIDLLATPATGFTFAKGVMDVKDGASVVAVLNFSGKEVKSDFSLTGDGHGGTVINFV